VKSVAFSAALFMLLLFCNAHNARRSVSHSQTHDGVRATQAIRIRGLTRLMVASDRDCCGLKKLPL
jgi:hypothetical protein